MTARLNGRIAGLVYLGVVATGVFTLAYVPGRIFADADPAAIASAISSNAALFDASNYAALAMSAFFLALPFALSRVLSRYGRNAARLLIVFVAASVPFSLLAVAQHFELGRAVADGAVAGDMIETRVASYDKWMDVASIFWGLWLAPLGWLILKSGAVPRLLGALLIFGCFAYLANYFGPILYRGYADLPFRGWLSMPGSLGEIGTCLWLLFMGARPAAAY